MRFLIHELPYERPLLAGRLRYRRDGAPMGAVESWRLTDAAEGYRFLRVDMDAREAPSGHSHLYHATLDPSGRLEQLKFRFWGQGHEVEGLRRRDPEDAVAEQRQDLAALQPERRAVAQPHPHHQHERGQRHPDLREPVPRDPVLEDDLGDHAVERPQGRGDEVEGVADQRSAVELLDADRPFEGRHVVVVPAAAPAAR